MIFIAKKPDIYSGLPGLLKVGFVVHYIPYFFLGVLMKIYNERFMKFIENNVAISILFVLWILGMIGRLYIEKVFHLYWTLPILSTIGVVVLFRFFNSFSETFSSETTVGRFMILLGRNSLQIYLLHWFFLKELQKLDWSSITPIIESTIVVETIAVGIISVIISYLCILVDRFLKPYPIVHGLLLGFDGRKKT